MTHICIRGPYMHTRPIYARILKVSCFRRTVSSMMSKLDISVRLEEVLAMYTPNATEGADNAPLAARLLSDLVFECGTRHLAQHHSAAWLYRFDQRTYMHTYMHIHVHVHVHVHVHIRVHMRGSTGSTSARETTSHLSPGASSMARRFPLSSTEAIGWVTTPHSRPPRPR